MSFLYVILGNIFLPIMQIGNRTTGALLTILIINVLWSLLLALVYKFLMDQKKSKELKGNIKELRKKVDVAKKENNVKKMNEYMKKSMEYNNKLLRMSLKPMVISMILVFLIFPWVRTTFNPEIPFEQINGTFVGELNYMDLNVPLSLNQTTGIINVSGYGVVGNRGYIQIEDTQWQIKSIAFSKDGNSVKVRPSLVFINLPFSLPFVERSIEWFGYYFIIGIPFTYLFRKLLKVA